MYCEKCGAELVDNARFCEKCGNKIINNNQDINNNISDTEILLHIKPKFSYWYYMTQTLEVIIFLLMFSAFIPFCMIYIQYKINQSINILLAIIVFILPIIFYFIVFNIMAAWDKNKYDKYTYDFYKTKAIFKMKFIDCEEKEIKYKNIREVTLRQTFFQKKFNLGNILLYTNAESGFQNGMTLLNVENASEIYRKIKVLIDV